MEMGNNPSVPCFHIQGRFSLGSPFLFEELPALLPWAQCSSAVCSLDAGYCRWWSPSGAFAALTVLLSQHIHTGFFFLFCSGPAGFGLTQRGRGGTAVGWDGLGRAAQKTSPEHMPESSAWRIFPCCWSALILMVLFFGMWEEPCSVWQLIERLTIS